MSISIKHAVFGAAATTLLLAALQGCGAGFTNKVYAAEQADSSPALQVQTANSIPGVQLRPGTMVLSATAGQTFAFQMQAAGGRSPYQWAVTAGSLPTGLSLSTSGAVKGTLAEPGTWNATVQVSDGSTPSKVQTEAVTFQVAPRPLAILSTSLPGGQAGSAYNSTLTSSGGTPKFTWSVISGSLPDGLKLNPNGTISGVPTKGTSSSFTVQVADAGSPSQKKTQPMTMAIANAPLVVTSTSIGSAQQGTSFSTRLRASGGDGTYTWSVASGSLPAGLSLTNDGNLSGKPANSGTSIFSVAVRDSSQRATANLSLAVAPAVAPLTVTTSSLTAAGAGSTYNAVLNATGGTPGYTWNLSSGTLPAGLTLSPSGVLSGTPTASGSSTFTVAVSDNGTPVLHSGKSLTLAVTAPALAITTGSITAAQSSTSYTAQLSATGGTGSYTWSITSGSLPAGLTLQATSGTILGTPSTTGNSSFTYQVADSGNPQQTASATATIAVGATPASLTAGTTWFIRTDGGTRYSSDNTAGQCDGKADMAYSGKGANQHCAFNDVRYMWMTGIYGNSAWVMQGGDTLVIRGCAALASQQNADAPHCRIGWDKATGNDSENFWCAGVSAWWGCAMPPPPSGTATQHTRILGGCAYGTYNCNPVRSYPYTNNNLTQLFGGFNSFTVMWLNGSKYVDLQGLELTSHNGVCARYGTTNSLPGCSRSISAGPLSDQADQGIMVDATTSDISMRDLYIHGFSSSGISGPIGGPFTLNNVSLDFNAFAGWNMDDGNSTPDAPGSSISQTYVTMIGNGCEEEYPITHPNFPAKGCWDTTSGGFGDSWSGQNTLLDSFTCDHCYISFNSKDAALGPHTRLKNLSLTNSYFGNNMGQQGKWGMQPNSTAYVVNNIIVGNCLRMSELIPGAAQNFDSSTGLVGSGLSGYCRAAGDIFAFFSDSNSSVLIANNTVVAASNTVFDLSCSLVTQSGCSTTPYRFIDNIFLGYTEPLGRGSNSGLAPGLFYNSDPTVHVQSFGNIEWGVRNGDACGNNGNLCVDPMLQVEPPQGMIPPEASLDVLNFHVLIGSPALNAGASYSGAPLSDYFGTVRQMISIGAGLN